MPVERLLDDLNDAQRAAVGSAASPLCILAGAGSGKTRVLTRRIAHRILTGTADAPHTLALTFTRKAAGELTHRLAQLGVRDRVVAGTFHSVAYAQLRRRWADRGEREPAILDRKVRIIVPLLGRFGSRNAAVQPADIAGEIEWAKARLIPASQYEIEAGRAGRTPPVSMGQMATIYEQYEAEKRRRGLVDFDDLLGMCARGLEADPDFAAAQRWRFRHLFVDEFQDVNAVQFQLLRGWLGDRLDLCVVGDPNQAIYSWNGADPRLLTSFTSLFPSAEVVRLDDNYRSTPQVLAVANAVLASAPGLRAAPPALRAHRPDGPVPSVRSYANDVQEARGVGARIRRVHSPTRPWSSFAVLARTNAQLVVFEEAFRALGIPYRLRGGSRLLDQPEVKDALATLRRAPAGAPLGELLTDVESLADDESAGGTEERRLNLEALVRLGREYLELDPQGSAAGFGAWLQNTLKGDDADNEGRRDAVELATFHRAKGLEWPTVFVVGLEKGFVPIGHASDNREAEAEERRLLYVAITRAREEAHCSWAERRTFGTKTVHRSPSPWLDVIDAACASLSGRAVDWKAGVRTARSKLGPVGIDADPEVLAALKAWRARAAKAANVPAYVIFHDTTLAAVAEAKPVDRAALLRIPGLGPVKAERYGGDLLALVAEHGKPA